LRAIVNKDILTTGFDHPPIDLIGMLRPTMSTGLWVQMLGRGTRPYDWTNPQQYIPGFEFVKHHCLVLDFAGNTRRLGPINDPVIPLPKGKGRAGDAPVKICGECGGYNHASAPVYGHVRRRLPNDASTLWARREPKNCCAAIFLLSNTSTYIACFIRAHVSKKGNNMIKVAYFCNGLRTFYEYVTVELDSFAGKRGRDWFRQRAPVEPPETNAEILANANTFARRVVFAFG
jgi:DNA repair protein RadD